MSGPPVRDTLSGVFQKHDDGPGLKTKSYATQTSDLDLKAIGGMGRGARQISASTGGSVNVVHEADGSEEDLTLVANEPILGFFLRLSFGTRASRDSGAGTYPGTLSGGETLVVRFDEGTVLDTGDVTVTFEDTDVTQALAIARINERMNELFPEPGGHPARVWAADEGSDVTSLTGRARGSTAKAEVVSQDAAIATMMGFTVGTSAGAQFGSPADGVNVTW